MNTDDSPQSRKDRVNNVHLEEHNYQNMCEFAKNIVVPSSTARSVSDSQCDTLPGQDVPPEIPNYEVLKQLGKGAMGTVWKVKQTNPIERELAIKVVGTDRLSGELEQRLEVERQALAIMEHSGIARMVDAGATQTGQPWFAMELFDGRRLDKFCDEEKLGVSKRLELFAKICEAVQHAHQKGVIHRDLKPSNILVRMVDGEPAAKVIDFGLAKATDNLAAWSTDETVHGQILGTIQYMSPEQASSDTPAIDLRTDIYSLGVVLYQLLCGKTPLSEEVTRETPIYESIRSILNVDPKRPSDRLEANTASDRQISHASLRALLKGDLDWVVMKAIEKDPDRRYQSASELAADVRRFLQREPVVARPPSAGYRLRKFVIKHRLPVAATALIGVLLIGGIVGTSSGWNRALTAEGLANERLEETKLALEKATLAERKAKHSQQAAVEIAAREKDAREHTEELMSQTGDYSEALRTVFKGLDPGQEREVPLEILLADRLFAAGQQIAKNDYDKPKYQLQLLADIGNTLNSLGHPQKAVELFTRSVSIAGSNKDKGRDIWIAFAANNLARGLMAKGHFKESGELASLAAAICEEVDGPNHKNTLSAKHALATALVQQGKFKPSIEILEEIIPARVELYGETGKPTLISMSVLATAYERDSQLDKASELMNRVYQARCETLGEDSVGAIVTLSNLAGLNSKLGNDQKSLELHAKALELFEKKLGPDHPNTLALQIKLAVSHKNLGDFSEAEAMLEAVIPKLQDRLGKSHPRTLQARSNLARIWQDTDRETEALKACKSCYQLAVAERGESDPGTLGLAVELARILRLLGEVKEATETIRQASEKANEKLGPIHATTADAKIILALCHADAGDQQAAIKILKEVSELAEKTFGKPEKIQLSSSLNLARMYHDDGQSNEASIIFDKLKNDWEGRLPDSHPALKEIHRGLSDN